MYKKSCNSYNDSFHHHGRNKTMVESEVPIFPDSIDISLMFSKHLEEYFLNTTETIFVCVYKWYLSVKRLTILWGNDHPSDFEFQTSQSSSTYFWAHNRHARAATEGLGSFFSFSATNISVKGSTNNVPGPPYSLCRNSLNTWIPQKKLIIETNFCKSFH